MVEKKKVDKELERTRKKGYVENLKNEVEQATIQIGDIEREKLIFEEEISARRKISEVILKHFKITNPTWEYETKEEYLSALKDINVAINKKAELSWDIQRRKFEKNHEIVEGQIESHKTQIERLEKELKEDE